MKMFSKVNFLKNKIKLFISNGYRIKVGKNSYILFKKEDYMNLIYLERVFFDLFKNLIFNYDEDRKIRLFFRLTLIEKYIESLFRIKIRILYDITKSENPLKIKIQNIWHNDVLKLNNIIQEKIVDLENKETDYKYQDIVNLLSYVIKVKYYKRNLHRNNSFHESLVYDS